MRTALRLLALVVLGVLGLTPAAGAAAGGGQVTIGDFDFSLPTITGNAGETVTWTNKGNRPHQVTDRGGLFDTGAILPGATATITLDVPGRYTFFCEINPSKMNGELVVQPGPDAPTEVRIQAVDEARDGAAKAFDPATLEVATGTRLILANVGGLRHSLVADDGAFRTAIAEPGAEQGRFSGTNTSVVVERPGTFPFSCEIHPAAMRGVVTVTDARVTAEDRAPPTETAAAATARVSTIDFGFDEADTVVAPGGTVSWTNDGAKPHTATFDDVELDTGRIEPGASSDLTAPTRPGSYSYFCSIHPTQMRGVLVVPPGDEVAAAPADPADDGPTDGTAFAYAVAVLVLGVGAMGLVLGLRKRGT